MSTTVDVVLGLLLISGAVATLATVAPSSGPESTLAADWNGTDGDEENPTGRHAAVETASLLGATTATVNYSLASGARHANWVSFPTTQGPAFHRTAHGTLAGLLARSAVRTVRVDGYRLTRAGDGIQRGVRAATESALARTGGVHVRAVWEPYPGAPVRGVTTAGERPPSTVDVHAARLTVPSGLPRVRGRALAAAQRGASGNGNATRAVARVLARGTVAGLFPPNRTRRALRGDFPVPRLTRHRYRRAGLLLGTAVTGPLGRNDIRGANGRLRAATTRLFASDLRRRGLSPRSVAGNASVGSVRVVVRTWSA